MKKSPLSPESAAKAARLAHRVHATLPRASKSKPGSRSLTPGEEPAAVLQSTLSTAPAEGAIKLEVSTLSPQCTYTLLDVVDQGLASTIYYPGFPAQIKTAVTVGKEAVLAAIQNVAAYEAALRTAAAACESIDRTDEALVSVGWTLRRTAGRPRPVHPLRPQPEKHRLRRRSRSPLVPRGQRPILRSQSVGQP